jgi:hypothetical protein
MFSPRIGVAAGILAAVFTSLSVHAGDGEYARGRVRLSDKTIVSDWGTVLRGCYWNPDVNRGQLPDRNLLRGIKSLGLNALHLWAECYWETPGANLACIDSCVEWCRQESLYCVICYGCCNKNNNFFIDSLTRFWQIYAPRYKDQTHVVYEIQNEPASNTDNWADSVIDMERNMYQLIRSSAPETHILFFSLSAMKGGSKSIARDVERLGPDIDWSNASIAFHGYFIYADSQATYLNQLFDQGIRMTCTEFPGGCNPEYNRYNEVLAKTYNAQGISYLHVCPLPSASNEIHSVVNSGVTWQPDFGNWPQPHVSQTVAAIAGAGRATRLERLTAAPVLTVAPRGASLLPSGTIYDLRGRIFPQPRYGAGKQMESSLSEGSSNGIVILRYGPSY